MRATILFAAAASASALALPPAMACAEPLPSSVAAMIDAAAATGNPTTLKTVADLAKKTNPASVAEIDAQVAALTAKAEKARVEKLAHQTLAEGIKGEGQIGLSNTTGGSNTIGVTASLKLSAETLHWKHQIAASANYEKENGVTSNDEFVVGYEGSYFFTRRLYALGTLSWERDPTFGYSSREAASLGLGWKLIDRRKVALALEAGPAVRNTDYIAVPEAPAFSQTQAAGRLAVTFSWKILKKTVFTEDAAGFLQSGGDSLRLTSAVTTDLLGALKARLSYVAQFESTTPPGIKKTDTTTRMSIVYGF
jgi:putative salt-induced outer membrane protein